MCYKTTHTAKPFQEQLKKDLPLQENGQEVTRILFEHFLVKTDFFELEFFQVFNFVFSEFVTFSWKTDKVIKKSYFHKFWIHGCVWYFWTLNIWTHFWYSWINFQSMWWKLLFLHKSRSPDKGKSNHWQSYLKKVFSKYCNKTKYV